MDDVNKSEPIAITMHVIGWNNKGVIGFMHGGGYLTYLGKSKDEVFDKIKAIYPKISDKTLKEVNKAQGSREMQSL